MRDEVEAEARLERGAGELAALYQNKRAHARVEVFESTKESAKNPRSVGFLAR